MRLNSKHVLFGFDFSIVNIHKTITTVTLEIELILHRKCCCSKTICSIQLFTQVVLPILLQLTCRYTALLLTKLDESNPLFHMKGKKNKCRNRVLIRFSLTFDDNIDVVFFFSFNQNHSTNYSHKIKREKTLNLHM